MRKLFLFAIAGLVIGCSSQMRENEPEVLNKKTEQEVQYRRNSSRDIIDVESFIEHNINMFGNDVRVFENYTSLYNELNYIQGLDYVALRQWQSYNQINSPIINSIIIHDSVLDIVAQTYGFHLENLFSYIEDTVNDQTQEQIDLEDLIFNDYDSIMSRDFADYVLTSYDEDGNEYLSPLGALNEQIFCNNLNLFVVAGNVHKYLTDGDFICPYDLYPDLASFTSIEEIDAYINANYLSEYVAYNSIFTLPDTRKHKTFMSNSDNSNQYRLKVEFQLSPYDILFIPCFAVDMKATNYKKTSNGSYRSFTSWTKIYAKVTICCPHEILYTTTFNTGWSLMSGNYPYCHLHYDGCGCPFDEISKIEIKARNRKGETIDEEKEY
ncbi:MAG: hypothetical protein MJZ82_01065 [Paludibacteraceae bacterium]|nr:hypothetical protein [Paludibacteraceae bacterium]